MTSCLKCDDTGSLSTDPYGPLDCASCHIATERAALNAWATQAGILRWNDGVGTWHLWLIHRHAVPAGHKAVPLDPTDEMVEAGFEHTGDPCWHENIKAAYRAMLAAAPEVPCKN